MYMSLLVLSLQVIVSTCLGGHMNGHVDVSFDWSTCLHTASACLFCDPATEDRVGAKMPSSPPHRVCHLLMMVPTQTYTFWIVTTSPLQIPLRRQPSPCREPSPCWKSWVTMFTMSTWRNLLATWETRLQLQCTACPRCNQSLSLSLAQRVHVTTMQIGVSRQEIDHVCDEESLSVTRSTE